MIRQLVVGMALAAALVCSGCATVQGGGGPAPSSPRMLQIHLKLKVSRAEFEKANGPEVVKVLAAVPGLKWKIWIMNEADQVAGGVYLFESDAALKAFVNGPIIGELKNDPQIAEVTIKDYDILREQSRGTRAPLK